MDTQPAWKRYLISLLPWIMFAVASGVATYFGVQPPPAPLLVEVPVEVRVPTNPEGYSQTFGWERDDDAISSNLDETKTLQFSATPAGKAVLGDEDVFLWRSIRKVTNRAPPWYSNVNQMNVGCCVGCGFKHAIDVLIANQVAAGRREVWKPVSAEVVYGLSRNDIGGGRIGGDGSVGAWARDAVAKLGVAAMEPFPSADLSQFSPSRARQFGSRSGVPADIKAAAKPQLVRNAALVRSWIDVKRAIQQMYPIAVCSNVGFTMERNAKGIARPSGTWNHCMAIIAVAMIDGKEYGFILNSWGDDAHTGGVFPDDMPRAGFWADANTIDRMVRQGDSFALADIQGFPARRPDWFLAVPRRDVFAIRQPLNVEVALSW